MLLFCFCFFFDFVRSKHNETDEWADLSFGQLIFNCNLCGSLTVNLADIHQFARDSLFLATHEELLLLLEHFRFNNWFDNGRVSVFDARKKYYNTASFNHWVTKSAYAHACVVRCVTNQKFFRKVDNCVWVNRESHTIDSGRQWRKIYIDQFELMYQFYYPLSIK